MATVEYAALAVLVSLVVAVGGAAVEARAVPEAVGAGLRRAYCLVAGGDCLGRGGPRPCVVRSRSRDREVGVALLVLRLRDGRTVLREELSDGRVRVTVVQGSGAAVAAQLGLEATIGGRALRVGGEARAGGDAALGRTFTVRDGAAADALVRRLDAGDAPAGGAVAGLVRFLRDPGAGGAEDARTVTVSTRAEAEVALKALGLGPVASAVAGVTGGVRVDRRTRSRTLLLHFPREVTAALGSPLGDLDAAAASTTDVELTLDPHRSPVELLVRRRDELRGNGAGRLREAEARLDLADPRARALASRLLHGDAGAAKALAARLASGARLDVRAYATTHAERRRGGTVKAGGGLGADVTTSTATARLLAARGREPGLGWAPRLDCLHSAGIAAPS